MGEVHQADHRRGQRSCGIKVHMLTSTSRLVLMAMVVGTGVLLASPCATAATINVANESQLRNALNNANNGDTIVLTANVTLTSDLPRIDRNVNFTIDGGNFAVSGADRYRGLVIVRGTVVINDLTIANALAQGGNGGAGRSSGLGQGSGGGGGGGLGGALFVGQNADVTINNVDLQNSQAKGGVGGGVRREPRAYFNNSGGGGGLFGNGQDGDDGNHDGAGGVGNGGCGGGCDGGFGGGGGGAATTKAGDGGFGGGGGGSNLGAAGIAGWGGSHGGAATGGNGAGLGGAIFVQEGAKLNLAGSLTVSGNSVAGGTRGGVRDGGAYGAGLFLHGNGSLAFNPGAGSTQTINDGIADQTGSAGFGGSWSLVKDGAGTTILAGTNAYSGGLVVNAGSLILAGTNSFTGKSPTTVNGGVLQGNTTNLTGDITNNGSVVFDQTVDGLYERVMSGTGTLTKTGGGILTLSGANTHSGGVIVNGGQLLFSSDSNLGAQGATVKLDNGTIGTSAGISINRNVTITNDGGFFSAGKLTWDGVISGSGSLVKSGAGTLHLTGANTYAGGTTVTAGNLQIDSDANLGGLGTSLILNGGNVTSDANTSFARNITLAGNAGINGYSVNGLIWSGNISGLGQLAINGNVQLTGNNDYTGGTRLVSGILRVASDDKLGAANTKLEFDRGSLRATDTFSSSRAVDILYLASIFVEDNKTLTLSGVVSGGNSNHIGKAGGGTLVLSGANTYLGNIYNNGGAVQGNSTSLRGNVFFDNEPNNPFARSLVFDQETDGVFSGTIQGRGSLIKLGDGKLILTGHNTYNLGTIVSAGILRGDAGSLQGNVLNEAAVIFDQGGLGTYYGAMSGTGTLDKDGGGKLTVVQDQTYTGVTNINAGEFNTNATFQSSVVNVNVGGTLSGNGKFFAVNNNGGTISPGNSIGTIEINGNFNMGSNSKYYAEINGATSDLIKVAGTANIQSSTFEIAHDTDKSAPPVLPGKTYTLITTQGGLTVTSPQVAIADFPFLSFTLSEDGFNGYLTTARSGDSFASLASTPNEKAVASALDAAGAGSPAWQQVMGATAAQARAAFTSLSNASIHANATGVMSEQSRYLRDAVTDRLRQDFAYGTNLDSGPSVLSYAPATTRNAYAAANAIPYVKAPPIAAVQGPLYAAWAQGIGSRGSLGGDGNASRTDHSLGGVISGVDVTFDSRWRMGVAGGYSQSSFSSPGLAASGSSESYHVAVYGGGQFGAWGLRGGASFSWNDIVTTRHVAVVNLNGVQRGAYTSNTTQVFGELGHRFRFGTAMLEPFANVAYVRVDGNVNEAGLFAVTGSSVLDTTYTTLGLRGGTNLTQTLTARGMLGWRHALGDISPIAALAFQSGGTAFALNGSPIARDALVAEAGLDLALTASASVGVTWSGQFANGAQNNAVKGNLTWRF